MRQLHIRGPQPERIYRTHTDTCRLIDNTISSCSSFQHLVAAYKMVTYFSKLRGYSPPQRWMDNIENRCKAIGVRYQTVIKHSNC